MFYGKFGEGEKEAFDQWLQALKPIFTRVYAQDNLIALQRTAGFLQDERFKNAFLPNALTAQERSIAWRLHTLTWAAEQCLDIPGDFVECGVYHGFSMAVVAAYVGFENTDKSMFLYDTFEGIPEEFNSEKRSNVPYDRETEADKDAIYKKALARFEKYPNITLVRGTVPHTFEETCPEQVAFLHLDMNSSKSEIAALDILYERMSPGGLIVFDDYGWSGYMQQKVAEDAYIKERGGSILELPTGQGLLIKK